jgi:integrase
VATFRKRGDTWRAEIKLSGVRESMTFDTVAAARAWAREREAEIASGRRGQIVARTVKQALERYAEKVSPKHKGERWERVRLGKLARVLPFSGRWLAEVTKADIADWRDSMTIAPASARREYGLLRAVFAVARDEWGWLHVSPFDKLSPPAAGLPRTRRVSDDELARICLALDYEPGKTPEYASHYIALAAMLSLETAMRQGEILSLVPADVALDRRVVRLRDSKNGSPREVPLSRAAVAILTIAPEFPVAAPTFDTLFRRARQRAGLLDLHFHDIRREATTRLASKLDPLTLAKVTGHRDVKILLATYYAPSMTDVASRLD